MPKTRIPGWATLCAGAALACVVAGCKSGAQVSARVAAPEPAKQACVDPCFAKRVDYGDVLWARRFQVGGVDYVVRGHPIYYEDEWCRWDLTMWRLRIDDVPAISGVDPISIWSGETLVARLDTRVRWYLADFGGSRGPLMVVFHDNLGAGGPIEFDLLAFGPSGSDGLDYLGMEWVDSECHGTTFYLRAGGSDHNGYPDVAILEETDSGLATVTTLAHDQTTGLYEDAYELASEAPAVGS